VEVWQNLLEVYQYLPLRKDQQKQELRADLLEGTERYEQLLKKKEKDDIRRLEKKFAEFSQLSVDTFAKLGDQNEALKVAEQRKNLCLSWFTPDNRDADIDSWNYQEVQDILLNEETAAIDWHISPTAITTFILWHNKKHPLLFRGNSANYLANKRLEDFKKWLATWKKDYQEYKQIKEKEEKQNHDWQKLMWDRLDNLAKILDTPRLLEHLAKAGIKQLILIPHRDLHLLPLHVLFHPPYTNLDYTITYLPSAQIGVDLKRLKANSEELPQAPSMLIVECPDTEKKSEPSSTLDFLYAQLEANVIAQQYHCPDENRITGKNATQEQVINGLKTNADIFHFTGHAYHDVREPRNSFLALANNEKLTMQDISNNFTKLGLSSYYLAALSACETGMSGKSGLIDEFVSLASGFLAVGTTYVISTLWKVNEIPAALLMIQFFQNLKVNSNPPLALKQAQEWLRTLTYAKLAEWCRDLSTEQENSGNLVFIQRLKNLADNAQEKSENLVEVYNTDRLISNCPFEHPDDWAGFIITGQANTQTSTIPYVK
jgi:CHAT domain-containing protein